MESSPPDYFISKLGATSLLAFAVKAGLRLCISDLIAQTPNLLCETSEPLLTTLIVDNSYLGGEEIYQMVQFLLDNGFTTHHDPRFFVQFLQHIYKRSVPAPYLAVWLGLARLLLERGQRIDIDFDIKFKWPLLGPVRCTPLHISPSPLARMILDRGADVNALSSDKRTPLDVCISAIMTYPTKNETFELACLLVERGGKIRRTSSKTLKLWLDRYSSRDYETETLRKSIRSTRIWSTRYWLPH
jgi:hypothetical protein